MSGENVAARSSGSIVATIEGRIQEAKCEGLIDNPSRCRTSIADLSCSPRPASSSEHGARGPNPRSLDRSSRRRRVRWRRSRRSRPTAIAAWPCCESRRVPAPSRSSFGFMVALLRCRWHVSKPPHAISPPAPAFWQPATSSLRQPIGVVTSTFRPPTRLKTRLAVVEYLRKLPFVDRQSIVVGGCSGGGDLALHVASRTSVCAVVAEEPAIVLMSGVFNNSVPKRGDDTHPKTDSF